MPDYTGQKRNYLGFLWHAVFLSITATFTEINTVIPAMILQTGGGELQVGIAGAIMIGMPLIAQLNFSGFLHGKPRKKPYLLLGINLRILSLFLIALTLVHIRMFSVTVALALIYAGLLLFTVSGAFATVSYVDLIGKSFSAEMRRWFFTRKQIISSSGILASALITRELLSVSAGYPGNYALLFFAAAGVLLVASGGFWILHEDSSTTGSRGTGYLKSLRSIPGTLKNDKNLLNYLLYLNSVGTHVALIPFYVSLAKVRYTLGPALTGNLLFLQISGMVATSFIWPRLVRKGGFRVMLKLWSFLSAVLPPAALAAAYFLPLHFYLALFFLVGAVISIRMVSKDAVTVELSTGENRVMYAGIVGTMNISIVVFPVVLGTLITAAGYTAVFLLVSASAAASFFFLRQMHCPVDDLDQAG